MVWTARRRLCDRRAGPADESQSGESIRRSGVVETRSRRPSLDSMGRMPTRGDVQCSAKRLDPKGLDLLPPQVIRDEMDPEDFRKIFGLRQGRIGRGD